MLKEDCTYKFVEGEVSHQPNITINDNIETLIICYKDKEYKFDLEKVLNLLCRGLEK